MLREASRPSLWRAAAWLDPWKAIATLTEHPAEKNVAAELRREGDDLALQLVRRHVTSRGVIIYCT